MKYHYFIGQKKFPFHLSVGAVLLNSKKKIYCHHLSGMKGKDAYLLMRETVKPGESLEKALVRGLKKEFGARAKLKGYLGSMISSFKNWQGAQVQKTTLYFLCKVVGVPKKVKWVEDHGSKGNKPEWKSAKFLIPQMEKQGRALKRTDFDESDILKRI